MENIIYLKDYKPLDWAVKHVEIIFDLQKESTIIQTKLHMRLQGDKKAPIQLYGEGLITHAMKVDEEDIDVSSLDIKDNLLTLTAPLKESFIIETKVEVNPKENTHLLGLYASSHMLCTQCEAEGFRRITWFTDRPDNLATWEVTLKGDKDNYPILLSNGNLIQKGELEAGKHFTIWQDPHPKPSYLFALVAGDLSLLHDKFITMSGKKVDLNIWVLKGNESKAEWSMQCLKKAFRWDEERYGREYDLKQFNIVSVPDFNMGAMENKSLNIFNDALFLANQASATDKDFERIDTVIAHEYFHNWTGNRITCRDWFQLSLKEGLTVYRDQQYTEENYIASTARMEQVNMIRNVQFKEDAGPLSHPIRPDHFVDISNFYTVTIYEKGAEIIRMLHNLLGDEAYEKGIKLYFDRHDGQAVTVEDFIKAFEDANKTDLAYFFRWYIQAGTPLVKLDIQYEGDNILLHFKQELPHQEKKKPQIIPIKFAGISPQGEEVIEEQMFILDDWQKTAVFRDIPQDTIISWNRDFSAPIKMQDNLSLDKKLALIALDTSAYGRSEAFFQTASHILLDEYEGKNQTKEKQKLAKALKSTLRDNNLNKGDLAGLMSLPSESYLNEQLPFLDPQKIRIIKENFITYMAQSCQMALKEKFEQTLKVDNKELTAKAMANRSLIKACLYYLACLPDEDIITYLKNQLTDGTNMTLRETALYMACYYHKDELIDVIDAFEQEFKDQPLVLDKYFKARALSVQNIEEMEALVMHPAFNLKNPNRARSLLESFAANLPQLHAQDGSGYAFMVKYLQQLDRINPEVASRVAQPLAVLQKLQGKQKVLLYGHLKNLRETVKSKTLIETLNRALS